MLSNTPDNITELKPNEVFVFGSNKAGNHAGGAARLAKGKFGAASGVGEGLVGNSYAFPTLNADMQPCTLSELMHSVAAFKRTAKSLPAVTFYLTRVGCGIAGFTESYMSGLFRGMPQNVVVPKGW